MKKINYTQSPLPFMGQKRKFLKAFKEALKAYPKDAVYVDLFGGSGLLAHTTKQHYPMARVIYNDYDNYRARIKAIPQTNQLIGQIRHLLQDCAKDKRIVGHHRESVLKLIKQHEATFGFVDYITMSSSLLFSMNYAISYEELEEHPLQLRKVERLQCRRLFGWSGDSTRRLPGAI